MKLANPLARIAIAQLCEGKSCFYCKHRYASIDDCIKRDVVYVTQGATEIACKSCYDKAKADDNQH